MKTPYLIQRVELRLKPNSHAKGSLDYNFSFDYMGAAEFEFGALPRSVAELRKTSVPEPVELVHRVGKNTYSSWYVGAESYREAALEFFKDQLGPCRMMVKCTTHLDDTYGTRKPGFGKMSCDGWWCVDPGAGWAFFRTQRAAQLWAESLRNPLVPKEAPPEPQPKKTLNKRR